MHSDWVKLENNLSSPLLMGYLMVKLMKFITIGKTNLDHFCCREDDV
jgi:hypothetical protein